MVGRSPMALAGCRSKASCDPAAQNGVNIEASVGVLLILPLH